MDIAYSQHSSQARRSIQSSLTLNQSSLTPITSRLPLRDPDELPELVFPTPPPTHWGSINSLEHISAPTSPGILSRSSSRVSLRKPVLGSFTKSKSTSNVTSTKLTSSKSPQSLNSRRGLDGDNSSLVLLSVVDRSDSDWLLRAGALISSETRESKGQSWLVSRPSSTGLTGQVDGDEEALGIQLAKDWGSRLNSRRCSTADADDEFSPVTARMSGGGGSRSTSRYGSRAHSTIQSRMGSKASLLISVAMREMEKGTYNDCEEEFEIEPDFVDLCEVENESGHAEYETVIKDLAKKGSLGLVLWAEKIMEWSIFAVEDDEVTNEDINEKKTETDAYNAALEKKLSFQDTLDSAEDCTGQKLQPSRPGEGVWQDAAWLLSVASKVLL